MLFKLGTERARALGGRVLDVVGNVRQRYNLIAS